MPALPRVPKRAILAVGICTGLAAPALARQVVGRALLAALGAERPASGPWPGGGGRESATLEIVRVTYTGARRGEAAALVGRLLEQLKR